MNPCLPLPKNLTPEAALALHEALSTLTTALWNYYEHEILELIGDPLEPPDNLQQNLDFVPDDLPF